MPHTDVHPMLQVGHLHWGRTLLIPRSTQCPQVRSCMTNTGRETGWSFLDACWETEDQHQCNPTRIREVRMGRILPSHLAGTSRVGVGLPASRTEIPGTSWASKSKLLGQDMQDKGCPCVYFGGFIDGGDVTLAFHPAVWKRAGPGAVSDLIPQTWHGPPGSEMSP